MKTHSNKATAVSLIFAIVCLTIPTHQQASGEQTRPQNDTSMQWAAWRSVGGRIEAKTVSVTSARHLAKNGWKVEPVSYSKSFERGEEEPLTNMTPPTPAPADGARIAIVDSGVNVNHPWFSGHIVAVGDNTGKMEHPWPLPDPNNSDRENLWYDGNGHGTHVAGIVLQNYPNAQIIVAKALDDFGMASNVWIANSITWAVDMKADVINLSLGGVENSVLMREAVNLAQSKGIIVVAAAGNAGHDTSPVFYPAAYPGVVAVAAIDQQRQATYYSNRGTYVDIATEGDKILSASRQGGLIRLSGTSMAAPKVAATMAKIRKLRPDWTAEQVINHVLASSDDAGPVGPDGAYGYGILNVGKSLDVSEMRAVGGTITAKKIKIDVAPVEGGVLISSADANLLRVYRYLYGHEVAMNEVNYHRSQNFSVCFCFSRDDLHWFLPLSGPTKLALRAEDALGIPYEVVIGTYHPRRYTPLKYAAEWGNNGWLVSGIKGTVGTKIGVYVVGDAYDSCSSLAQWCKPKAIIGGGKVGKPLRIKTDKSEKLYACYISKQNSMYGCIDQTGGSVESYYS